MTAQVAALEASVRLDGQRSNPQDITDLEALAALVAAAAAWSGPNPGR